MVEVSRFTARGLGASRMTSVGVVEAEPIASDDDESGRALNWRMEVVCRED